VSERTYKLVNMIRNIGQHEMNTLRSICEARVNLGFMVVISKEVFLIHLLGQSLKLKNTYIQVTTKSGPLFNHLNITSHKKY